jgi:hypothetical protein
VVEEQLAKRCRRIVRKDAGHRRQVADVAIDDAEERAPIASWSVVTE